MVFSRDRYTDAGKALKRGFLKIENFDAIFSHSHCRFFMFKRFLMLQQTSFPEGTPAVLEIFFPPSSSPSEIEESLNLLQHR